MANKNRTGTARQQRRRKREKEWLVAQGWNSWEALHTSLLSGKTRLMPLALIKAATPKTSGELPVGDSVKYRRMTRVSVSKESH
jgi:hypothetical protein